MPDANWEIVLRTALDGTFHTTKRSSARCSADVGADRERLVARGLLGSAGQTNYAAAKGRSSPSRSPLPPRWAQYGVTVNAVAPGFIETDMISFLSKEAREDFLRRISAGASGRLRTSRPSSRSSVPRGRPT